MTLYSAIGKAVTSHEFRTTPSLGAVFGFSIPKHLFPSLWSVLWLGCLVQLRLGDPQKRVLHPKYYTSNLFTCDSQRDGHHGDKEIGDSMVSRSSCVVGGEGTLGTGSMSSRLACASIELFNPTTFAVSTNQMTSSCCWCRYCWTRTERSVRFAVQRTYRTTPNWCRNQRAWTETN